MSSNSDYLELLDEIQAIVPEKTIIPTMPVDVFVQEAEDLYHWCQDDKPALIRAGLDWMNVEQLPVRAGACRESQSRWNKERNTRQKDEQAWKEQSPLAFELRDRLLHSYRYAFRNDEGLLSRVEDIATGDSNADMVQDLNDLSVLGKANLDLLAAIGFDAALLDEAALTSDLMGDLLGATNGERKKDSEAMLIRDKAFTHLKAPMDEIRNCGKYVFWKNPDRLEGYVSAYFKRKNIQTEKVESKVEA
ncbi:MAG TPA: hypothetical protein VFC67_11030 [Prolixibacteraceae bacterium]|nr:hypothetical protein [Prolixibacteraceae bacterium]